MKTLEYLAAGSAAFLGAIWVSELAFAQVTLESGTGLLSAPGQAAIATLVPGLGAYALKDKHPMIAAALLGVGLGLGFATYREVVGNAEAPPPAQGIAVGEPPPIAVIPQGIAVGEPTPLAVEPSLPQGIAIGEPAPVQGIAVGEPAQVAEPWSSQILIRGRG